MDDTLDGTFARDIAPLRRQPEPNSEAEADATTSLASSVTINCHSAYVRERYGGGAAALAGNRQSMSVGRGAGSAGSQRQLGDSVILVAGRTPDERIREKIRQSSAEVNRNEQDIEQAEARPTEATDGNGSGGIRAELRKEASEASSAGDDDAEDLTPEELLSMKLRQGRGAAAGGIHTANARNQQTRESSARSSLATLEERLSTKLRTGSTGESPIAAAANAVGVDGSSSAAYAMSEPGAFAVSKRGSVTGTRDSVTELDVVDSVVPLVAKEEDSAAVEDDGEDGRKPPATQTAPEVPGISSSFVVPEATLVVAEDDEKKDGNDNNEEDAIATATVVARKEWTFFGVTLQRHVWVLLLLFPVILVAAVMGALAGTGSFGSRGGDDVAAAQETGPAPNHKCTWSEPLLPDDGGGNGNPFGPDPYNIVAMDGDTAAVGYPMADGERGVVNVLTRNGETGEWELQAVVSPSMGANDDGGTAEEGGGIRFGQGVAISGNVLVVGAPHDGVRGERSGSAYLFTRTGHDWTERAKFVADDGAPLDRVGWDAAVNDELTAVIIGAYGDDDERGSAYVLGLADGAAAWELEAKVVPDDGMPFDMFGFQVDISGDNAIVGAPWDDDMADKSGGAYIFHRGHDGTWNQQGKLVPEDGGLDHRFGERVAIDGTTIIVTSWLRHSPAAHVYALNGTAWELHTMLVPDEDPEADWKGFGMGLDLKGDTAIVGGYLGTSKQGAYLFARSNTSTWDLKDTLTVKDFWEGDENFGLTVAVSDTAAILGGPRGINPVMFFIDLCD